MRRIALERNARVIMQLDSLPHDLGRNRIFDSKNSAQFWGVSLPHWRRLYRAGKVPTPIKVGDRKYGWRLGDLIDALAERARGAQ
jgi:predicted DNA-binding transcriptional regulator AlpA